jgi:hypothetical protein
MDDDKILDFCTRLKAQATTYQLNGVLEIVQIIQGCQTRCILDQMDMNSISSREFGDRLIELDLVTANLLNTGHWRGGNVVG